MPDPMPACISCYRPVPALDRLVCDACTDRASRCSHCRGPLGAAERFVCDTCLAGEARTPVRLPDPGRALRAAHARQSARHRAEARLLVVWLALLALIAGLTAAAIIVGPFWMAYVAGAAVLATMWECMSIVIQSNDKDEAEAAQARLEGAAQ